MALGRGRPRTGRWGLCRLHAAPVPCASHVEDATRRMMLALGLLALSVGPGQVA